MLGIIIACISVVICLAYCIYTKVNTKKINEDVQKNNEVLLKRNQELGEQNKQQEAYQLDLIKNIEYYEAEVETRKDALLDYGNQIFAAKTNIYNLNTQEKETRERIAELSKTAEDVVKAQKELALSAFEDFKINIEKQKAELKIVYDEYEELLKKAYSDKQEELIEQTSKLNFELDNAKQARAALIEATRREKEIKDNSSFYCIEVSDEDKSDIARLETVAKTLHKPRVLYMLIWQTYYQKPLKSLSANLLGTKSVTGIYKITNIITGECYIGQAVDIASRWAEHCKCGLGIDTPASNKLYKAMQEYGLYNFAFECLEECESKRLNERESNYIEFYQSYDYGYNSTRGNK